MYFIEASTSIDSACLHLILLGTLSYHGTQAALEEEIDKDQLLAHYGGTGPVDDDPACPRLSGGVVPKSMYMVEHMPTEGFTKLEVCIYMIRIYIYNKAKKNCALF